MKKTFDLVVQVVYDGTIRVMADSLSDAEARVRGIAKPQGVFCSDLIDENENFDTDPTPTVHFLHHSEIPEEVEE